MSGSDVLWSRLAQLFTMLSLQNPQFEAHLAVDEAAEKMKESGRIPFPEDQVRDTFIQVDLFLLPIITFVNSYAANERDGGVQGRVGVTGLGQVEGSP